MPTIVPPTLTTRARAPDRTSGWRACRAPSPRTRSCRSRASPGLVLHRGRSRRRTARPAGSRTSANELDRRSRRGVSPIQQRRRGDHERFVRPRRGETRASRRTPRRSRRPSPRAPRTACRRSACEVTLPPSPSERRPEPAPAVSHEQHLDVTATQSVATVEVESRRADDQPTSSPSATAFQHPSRDFARHRLQPVANRSWRCAPARGRSCLHRAPGRPHRRRSNGEITRQRLSRLRSRQRRPRRAG